MLLFIFVEQGLEFARKSFARTRTKRKNESGKRDVRSGWWRGESFLKEMLICMIRCVGWVCL